MQIERRFNVALEANASVSARLANLDGGHMHLFWFSFVRALVEVLVGDMSLMAALFLSF